MKDISDLIKADHIIDISAKTKDDVLVEMCDLLTDSHEVIDSEGLLDAVRERENLMSTGIGHGIAIPHAQTQSVRDFVIAVGRCKKGMDFESLDGLPVHVIILTGVPGRKRLEFLSLIAKIGELFIDPSFKERFLAAGSPLEMAQLLAGE